MQRVKTLFGYGVPNEQAAPLNNNANLPHEAVVQPPQINNPPPLQAAPALEPAAGGHDLKNYAYWGLVAFFQLSTIQCAWSTLGTAGYSAVTGAAGAFFAFGSNTVLTAYTTKSTCTVGARKMYDAFVHGYKLTKAIVAGTIISGTGSAVSILASTWLGLAGKSFWEWLSNFKYLTWVLPVMKPVESMGAFGFAGPSAVYFLHKLVVEGIRAVQSIFGYSADHNSFIRSMFHESAELSGVSGKKACEDILELEKTATNMRASNQGDPTFLNDLIAKIKEIKSMPREEEADRKVFCKTFFEYTKKLKQWEQMTLAGLVLKQRKFVLEGLPSYVTYLAVTALMILLGTFDVTPALYGILETGYNATFNILTQVLELFGTSLPSLVDTIAILDAIALSLISDPAKTIMYIVSTRNLFLQRLGESWTSLKWLLFGIDGWKPRLGAVAINLFSLPILILTGACYSKLAVKANAFVGAEPSPSYVYWTAIFGAGLVNWASFLNWKDDQIPVWFSKNHLRGYDDLSHFLRQLVADMRATFPDTPDGRAYFDGLEALIKAMPHPSDANDDADIISWWTRFTSAAFFTRINRTDEKAEAWSELLNKSGPQTRERNPGIELQQVGDNAQNAFFPDNLPDDNFNNLNDLEANIPNNIPAPVPQPPQQVAQNRNGFFARASSTIGNLASSVGSAVSYAAHCCPGNSG